MYPFIRWFEDPRAIVYLYMIAGLLAVSLFIKTAHTVFPRSGVFRRPSGACDCDILNSAGSYEHRGGMPSGHVMTAAFVVTMICLMNPSSPLAVVASAVTVLLIATARVQKRCHTVLQVAVGAAAGVAWAFVCWYVYRK